MVFPLLYALWAMVVLARLAAGLPANRYLLWYCGAPIGMAVADVAENVLGLFLISAGPEDVSPALSPRPHSPRR